MEIKSITRTDGKIRIISANSEQERVDDFDDYGLPEVDHLIKSFLEYDVVYHVEASEISGEDHYKFGNCSYASYSYIHISGSKSEAYKYIDIGKHITTIGYKSYTYIIYGCARFTTDIISWKWDRYLWLYSKKFVKQFNDRHITEQSLKKYAAAVEGLCFSCRRMEVIERDRFAPDLPTKLQCRWH